MEIVKIWDWIQWGIVLVPAVIFSLGSIAAIHEFGHYIVSVLCGVAVHEFALGVGKPFFIRKWGETFFTLRPYPIAAFVKPAGMDQRDDLEYLRISKVKGVLNPKKPLLEQNSCFETPILPGTSFVNHLPLVISSTTTLEDIIGEINKNSKNFGEELMASFIPNWSLFSIDNPSMNPNEIHFEPPTEFEGNLSNFFQVMGFIPSSTDRDRYKGRRFNDKNFFQKQAIFVAGATFNFFLAYFFLLILFFGKGKPLQNLMVNHIGEKSPARSAGVKENDVITQIGGVKITDRTQGISLIKKAPGIETVFSIQRPVLNTSTSKFEKWEALEIKITPEISPGLNGENFGRIGVGLLPRTYDYKKDLTMWERHHLAFDQTLNWILATLGGLLHMLSNPSTDNLSGPVAIVGMIGETAQNNFFDLLSLVAILSVNIGILNLLPIPALDGGRMLFLLVEMVIFYFGKLFGKHWILDPKFEETVTLIGIFFLFSLLILASFGDLKNIFLKYFIK